MATTLPNGRDTIVVFHDRTMATLATFCTERRSGNQEPSTEEPSDLEVARSTHKYPLIKRPDEAASI